MRNLLWPSGLSQGILVADSQVCCTNPHPLCEMGSIPALILSMHGNTDSYSVEIGLGPESAVG